MFQSRRAFLGSLAGFGCFLLTGAARSSSKRNAASLSAGLAFLAAKQSRDGAWRSDHYGTFREGDTLTPLALWAMQSAPPELVPGGALLTGLRWLERLTDSQFSREDSWTGLRYPLFTASYAAQVFVKSADTDRAGAWAGLVEKLRASSELGWPADGPSRGAWSDSPFPPQLPKDAQTPPDMLAPNLSATVLGLRALHACGRRAHLTEAVPFVANCQNLNAASFPSEFDDGGFFFAPEDSIRNKAGVAGRDIANRVRFNSYGSATCDGILALDLCGFPLDHPRMAASISWLQSHGAGLGHGGHWMPDRERGRESLIFYYGQAFSDCLAILSREQGIRSWALSQQDLLSTDLASRQGADGHWAGSAPDSCEDDPILATVFAVRALAQIAGH